MIKSANYRNKANNAVLCAETMRKVAYCDYRVYDMRECQDGAYEFDVVRWIHNDTETVTIRCEYDENMVSRYGVCTLYAPLSENTAKYYDSYNLLSDKIENNAELKQFVDSLYVSLRDIYHREHIYIL